MNSDEVLKRLHGLQLVVPMHWPDAERAKGPQKLLNATFRYVLSKNHHKLRLNFAVGNRGIDGTGTTMHEAVLDAIRGARVGYGKDCWIGAEAFER